MPAVPKPPIRMVEPCLMPSTAAAAEAMILSITARSLPVRAPILLVLGVELGEAASLGRQFLEQRRDFPARPVLGLVGLDALSGRLQSDHIVDLPHRAAAPGREAVAVEVHGIDVTGSERDTLLEDLGALVGEPQQAALHDFIGGNRPLLNL